MPGTEDRGLNKDQLYGRYQAAEDRKAKLALRVAHKALDMPDEDMRIEANRTNTGVDPRAVIGLAALTGLLPVLGAGATYLALHGSPAPATPPVAPPVATQPITPPKDSEYVVRFFDKDGKPIEVPPLSSKPK